MKIRPCSSGDIPIPVSSTSNLRRHGEVLPSGGIDGEQGGEDEEDEEVEVEVVEVEVKESVRVTELSSFTSSEEGFSKRKLSLKIPVSFKTNKITINKLTKRGEREYL